MGLLNDLQEYIKANTPRSTRPRVSPSTVFDQGLLGGRIGQIPQRAQEMYQGLLSVPSELKKLTGPQALADLNQTMKNPSSGFDKEKGMQMAMDLLQTTNPVGGLLAHTVYHGSPHKFDKFDMSKIGTGEGAQAYGHGLYFAESPGVAKSYADSLGIQKQDTVNNAIDRIVNLNGGDVSRTRDALMLEGLNEKELTPELIDTVSRIVRNTDAKSGTVNNQAIKAYDDLKRLIPEAGQMYKVDIPDESIHRMLDWDKPLSEQAPEVRSAVESLMKQRGPLDDPRTWGWRNPSNVKGRDAYEMLTRGNQANPGIGAVAATDAFKNSGIPGIRYLDGNSRGTGGTSNFVLFDDQLPRILEVNGQPTGLLSYADEAKKAKRQPTKYELAHETAQKNAVDMLGLPPGNTAMDRAKAMGFDTPAYHATGSDIKEFKPSSYRGASFFSGTPQGAYSGRNAGIGDMTATLGSENVIPALLKSNQIDGLSYSPKELDILSKYKGKLTENQVDEAAKELGGSWYKYFNEIDNGNGTFSYVAKSPITYDAAKSTRKNVKGESISDYYDATSERFASDYTNSKGMGGYLQNDESGLSMAMTNPNAIRSRFAAFDPARANESDLLAGLAPYLGLGGLLGLGIYGKQDDATY